MINVQLIMGHGSLIIDKMMQALWPPKPKELDITRRMSVRRAVLGT
jgi:hypothetical protein